MKDAILIVDDSLTVRMDLTSALTAARLRAVPCGSLADARKALAREPFALIILDVLLPDGDGVEFLRELRASTSPERSSTPVMLLSTEAEVRDRARGLVTGADDYVSKPYDTHYVVSRAHELVRRSKKPHGAQAGMRQTVLVIDDSVTFREELRRVLLEAGHAVVVAESGEEGLRMAADVRPAAIVVDSVLPGIDGATAVRRIRLDAALRRTPCLLLTASGDAGAELQALEAGADAFVRKDEDIAIVLARLAAVMRSAGAAAQAHEATSLLGPKRLLAVDDSPTYLNAIGDVLRGEGYDVLLARSGEEAIELLALQTVDCILLDLQMPGLGGEETCRRIKSTSALRDVPLVMLTALDDREAMIRGLEAGADDYIAKSSDVAVLKARVLAQLRRKQFEDENRSMREQLLRTELEAHEARAARELAETRALLIEDIERKNKELEAFSYSVSHDLRAPLRAIDGFSKLLLDEHASRLDPEGQDYLRRVRTATLRMSELIDDLLEMSRVTRAEMQRERVDVSSIARSIAAELQRAHAERTVEFAIDDGIVADADPRLVRIILENLLGNAWKFTAKSIAPRIELGTTHAHGQTIYYVRDNGAGFDMAYAGKLFTPFQRLHAASEFPGTGVGLATVGRIVERHGGRIWAEGAVGQGATVFWTLPSGASSKLDQ
jgi:DNA-binding response OmpR family regulator